MPSGLEAEVFEEDGPSPGRTGDMKVNGLTVDLIGAVDVLDTMSFVCSGPFWVFLGASLTSAMAFSFVVEKSGANAHTLHYQRLAPPRG